MRRWYPVLLIVIAYAGAIVAYPRLPAVVPTHWGLGDGPDGSSPRFVACFLLPAIALIVWPVLRLLPSVDPRRASYVKFQGTYDVLVAMTITGLVVTHLAMLGRHGR